MELEREEFVEDDRRVVGEIVWDLDGESRVWGVDFGGCYLP